MHQRNRIDHGHIPRGRTGWVLAGFLAIALFFLLTEHRAHLFGILPYLLLLSCPLMHLFHHHGRHDHGRQQQQNPEPPGPAATDAGSRP